MTRSDVIAKLREANVLRIEDVQAVVLETTGDISVLHGPHRIEPILLEGLRREPATTISGPASESRTASGDG